MKKLFLLATLLFGLLMAGCSEESAPTSNNLAGFEGDNPALSISTEYIGGGYGVSFSVSYFGTQLTDATNKFQWSFGDDASGGSNTAATATPSHTFSAEGTYTVTVSVSDAAGTSIGKTTTSVLIADGGVVTLTEDIVVTDTANPLTKQISTRATTTSRVPLKYEWDFKDGGGTLVGPNNVTHTFAKYNKEYAISVTATDMISGNSATGVLTPALKIPLNVSIQCTQNGSAVSCTPSIPSDITDAVVKWNFGSETDIITTVGNQPAAFTFESGGSKTVTAYITSSKIEGEVSAETTVQVASNVVMQPIVCDTTGNLLEYKCSVSATVADGKTGTITYKWSSKTDNLANIVTPDKDNTTIKFTAFPPAENPVHIVQVAAELNNGGEENTAVQTATISIPTPTVSISSDISDNGTVAKLEAVLSQDLGTGTKYAWTITDPNGQNVAVDATSTVKFTLDKPGTYTAELTVTNDILPAKTISAKTQVRNSGVIKDAEIVCSAVNGTETGMEWMCSTSASAIGESGQPLKLSYQWNVTRGDNGESYSFNTQSFQQKFKKYNGTYKVNLVLIAEGIENAVAAPTKVITTPNLTVDFTASSLSIKAGQSVKFNAQLGDLIENVPLPDINYTWIIEGHRYSSGGNSEYTHKFTSTLIHEVRVEVTSSSIGGAVVSPQQAVYVNKNVVSASDIKYELTCDPAKDAYNKISRECTLKFSNGNELAGMQDYKIYLIPKGVDGRANGTPVVYAPGESGTKKTIVFDWPYLNLANVTDYTTMPDFKAKVLVQLYNGNKKVADLGTSQFTTNYPQVYYEVLHNVKDRVPTRSLGTDAKLTFINVDTQLPANYTYEWRVNMNGKSGTLSKTIPANIGGKGQEIIDLTADMEKVRFAGTMDGNPFIGENGIGLKISGGSLSKPIYIYGTNTYIGKNKHQNALGKFLQGKSWISPKAELGFVGNQGKNSITGGFVVPIHILLDNRSLDATGWDQFCIIGLDGIDIYKNRYALPKAVILPQGNSPGHGKYSYYTVVGTQWDHERGYTEERTTGVTAGQPSIPLSASPSGTNEVVNYKYFTKGRFVDFSWFGFQGVHIGYMTKSGDLSSCKFAKLILNNHKEAYLVRGPKAVIPENMIP